MNSPAFLLKISNKYRAEVERKCNHFVEETIRQRLREEPKSVEPAKAGRVLVLF